MKKAIILCVIFCLLILSGCDTQNNDVVISTVDYNMISLDEAISKSTCAVVGTYVETDNYTDYVYYRFDVDSVIYGAVPVETVDMYATRTILNMEDRYEAGKQYVLILKEMEPTIYETELRYISPASENMFPVDGPYTMYGDEVEIPDDMDFISYVEFIYDELHEGEVNDTNILSNEPAVIYNSTEDEIVGESQFIGYVTVNEMVFETESYTNTYVCTVSKLLKGQNLSVRPDGTIFMALTKGLVQEGEQYLIGFNQVDVNSLVYSQSTLESVIGLDDALLDSILSTLETEVE